MKHFTMVDCCNAMLLERFTLGTQKTQFKVCKLCYIRNSYQINDKLPCQVQLVLNYEVMWTFISYD